MTASYGCLSRWEPFYIPDSNVSGRGRILMKETNNELNF